MNDSALNNYEHTLFINSSAKILKVIDETVRIFDLSENKSCSENAIDILYAYEAGEKLQKYMGTWLVCFIAIVGILLNILCIYASSSKEAPKNLFNMLLINILSWDTVFLILHLFLYSLANIAQHFSFCLISKIRAHPSSGNEICHGHVKDIDNEITTAICNRSLSANVTNENGRNKVMFQEPLSHAPIGMWVKPGGLRYLVVNNLAVLDMPGRKPRFFIKSL